MIQSTTKTGIAVTLTGEEHLGQPVVRATFRHPQKGDVSLVSGQYGTAQGNEGILGHVGGQRACVTVPRADFEAAMAEAKAAAAERALARKKAAEEELAALKSGTKKIEVRYVDGEYLSGYTVDSPASGLLRGLGLATDVSGWGVHVDGALVTALGNSFSYAQAAEFARPALEAKQAARQAAEAARFAKFAEARQAGRKVELQTWSAECDESVEECSTDIVTEWAMPDGTTTTTRVHTH